MKKNYSTVLLVLGVGTQMGFIGAELEDVKFNVKANRKHITTIRNVLTSMGFQKYYTLHLSHNPFHSIALLLFFFFLNSDHEIIIHAIEFFHKYKTPEDVQEKGETELVELQKFLDEKLKQANYG